MTQEYWLLSDGLLKAVAETLGDEKILLELENKGMILIKVIYRHSGHKNFITVSFLLI